jgi:O-antigen/teichoic acid export membrane protein
MSSTSKGARFIRDVLTLAGGAAASQAISIVSAPINTRLYTPSDYGALGAYMSVSGLASTSATLLFHYPIVLAEDEEEARRLVVLSLISSAFVAVLIAVSALLLGPTIARHLGVPQLRGWFLVLPFSTFCAGVGATCNSWVNRRGAYKLLASARFLATLVPVVVTIGLGLTVEGPTGLLAGLASSHLFMASLSIWAARKVKLRVEDIGARDVRAVAQKYRAYPFFTLPTELISNWTNWLPVHLLITFSGANAIGAYSMAARMLGMPSAFVGASVSEVFRQRAAEQFNATGSCRPLLKQTAKSSLLVAGPVFLCIAIAGPTLFAFVFGEPWRDAGRVARLLSALFCLQFVVSPITVVYYIRGRLREDMVLHVMTLASIGFAMIAVHHYSSEPLHLLGAYAASYGLMYLVYLVRSYQLAGHGFTTEGGRDKNVHTAFP